jgi:hypothetical protein
LNSPPPLLSFIFPKFLEISTDIIFAFIYMCIHYLCHIHPPTTFPTTSPLPPVSNFLPQQNLFCPPMNL